MQVVTHIYNNKNVVIRNFTIRYFIEAEDQDSDRDKLICEHLKLVSFRGKPRYIIEYLLANPNEYLARALLEIGAGEWVELDLDLTLETVAVADSHATLYRDFSFIVCSETLISSHSNICACRLICTNSKRRRRRRRTGIPVRRLLNDFLPVCDRINSAGQN